MDGKDEENETPICQQVILIDDKLHEYRVKLLKLTECFESLRNTHSGWIVIAEQQLELKQRPETSCSVTLVAHGHKHESLKNHELRICWKCNYDNSIVFAPDKYGPIRI